MLGRAAGPAPSFPPARPNRNLLQCCGEPGGRGAGGPRAAPASSCGGKAGGRAPGLLSRSLSPSLPPSAGGFSQLACSPPDREPQRAGASDAGAASCHCSSGRSCGWGGSPGPRTPGEARQSRRARAGGVGVALSPRGRSGRPPRRRRCLCLQPPCRPGSRGLEVGRGLRSRGRGQRSGRRGGQRGGPRFKVRRGVSSCGGVRSPCRPVSHRAVGGSPGTKPGGQRCGGRRRCWVPLRSGAGPS